MARNCAYKPCSVQKGLRKPGGATRRATLLVMVVVFLFSCGKGSEHADTGTKDGRGVDMALDLTSAVFGEGGAIASRYTCDGPGSSPPLSWGSVPNGTRSLALTVHDPDAPGGTFVHWVIYDLPPDTRRLPEDVPNRRTLPSGAEQGLNRAGTIGYTGPCPPSGTHRYIFEIYALDTKLDLGGGATAQRLSDAMDGHVLAEGRLMGTYRRR